VRGLYPAQLDEEGAYAIGRAYVEQFEPRRIAIGRDMRTMSPQMQAAAIEGAADGGADVLDVGLVGTEMVDYAVGALGLDGGIAVEEGADLDVAYDGDADRCVLDGDEGEFIPADFVTALRAAAVLENDPGAKLIYDVGASCAVPETIERNGGIPLVNRVGHAF